MHRAAELQRSIPLPESTRRGIGTRSLLEHDATLQGGAIGPAEAIATEILIRSHVVVEISDKQSYFVEG